MHPLVLSCLLVLLGPLQAKGTEVLYTVQDQTFAGSFYRAGAAAPLVVILHDWDGPTAYEQRRARMLVEEGYDVFVADLYGEGVRPTERAEMRRLAEELYGDRHRMRLLMDAALKAAGGQGADLTNSLAVGYCFGGAAVLEWARSGAKLKGFVSFHGGLGTPEDQDYSRVRGEVLVFHGSRDAAVSLEEFAELAEDLEAASIPHEMTTYSGAPHAFTVFGSPRYHPLADRRSWARFRFFLREVLH
ncbi:dienelactone hydrolase family protein [Desulfogranum mediterraneum]|uniref:dienelactone hydrolase family protein n=1 Tax=Desulfogranum mediterraneum TaxID=160661 RepID=UPI00041E4598|nr:dienelactone hydrolase family protein [Desulfogranum mediterraneum]